MKVRFLAILCFSACVLAAPGAFLHAQGKGSGGPPGGPPAGGPWGPGQGGAPGGSGGPPPSGSRAPNPSAGGGAGAGVQFGPVGRWWDDRTAAKSVGLSSEQKKKMDAIFDANKPAILAAYKNFLSEQSKLAALSKDPQADKARTFAAIDAVNQARAALQKATTQMYLEIRQQLSADQIEQVGKLQ